MPPIDLKKKIKQQILVFRKKYLVIIQVRNWKETGASFQSIVNYHVKKTVFH
jgi:hypothetical protein